METIFQDSLVHKKNNKTSAQSYKLFWSLFLYFYMIYLVIQLCFNTVLRRSVDWIKSSLLLKIQWKVYHYLCEHGFYSVQNFQSDDLNDAESTDRSQVFKNFIVLIPEMTCKLPLLGSQRNTQKTEILQEQRASVRVHKSCETIKYSFVHVLRVDPLWLKDSSFT